jgi:hypothetical protein
MARILLGLFEHRERVKRHADFVALFGQPSAAGWISGEHAERFKFLAQRELFRVREWRQFSGLWIVRGQSCSSLSTARSSW